MHILWKAVALYSIWILLHLRLLVLSSLLEVSLNYLCLTSAPIPKQPTDRRYPPYLPGCPHCGKQYTSRCHVLRHIRNFHLNIKPFKCPQCHKRFPDDSQVRRHVNEVHLKIKPLKCRFCDLYFSRTTGRDGHERAKH